MFTTGLDIANRALQYVGATRIASFTDNSKQAAETNFAYPLLRQAELRRTVWRCATKRAVLRPLTSTTRQLVPPVWAVSAVYTQGQIVQDTNGLYWVCVVPNTGATNNEPGTYIAGQPQYWQQWFGVVFGDNYSHTTSYYAGELVIGADNNWYLSLINGNIGNDTANVPTTHWVEQPSGSQIFSTIFLTAAGPGVTINNVVRNLFPLPLYYLRMTNPDPKVGSTATNVVSASLRFLDWELEGNYIVSSSSTPLIVRYVADVADVTLLDPLFCEALAARLAYSVCEILTQSNIKLAAIGQAYSQFVKDARVVDLIETGSTEPDESTYFLATGPAGVVDNVPSGGQRNAGSPEG